MTLDKIAPGHGGTITQVGGEGVLRRRLLDMGLTPGTRVAVRKIAPMGDPIELFLRSYVLTIRKEEAANIAVEEVEAAPRRLGRTDERVDLRQARRRHRDEEQPQERGHHPHGRGRWGR